MKHSHFPCPSTGLSTANSFPIPNGISSGRSILVGSIFERGENNSLGFQFGRRRIAFARSVAGSAMLHHFVGHGPPLKVGRSDRIAMSLSGIWVHVCSAVVQAEMMGIQ